jgi:hypothetical protein
MSEASFTGFFNGENPYGLAARNNEAKQNEKEQGV